ncbi:bifunctional lysylphosphatidylglycerol flippase/synthetase MprF [Dactylosporangium cerinum]|uniref:Bifunctional lysylphosphatidylglycerol flippase/synthetase MprF n=1 Tax=Dactylosporangium cerinum TaxID=1434730 RepID=A0ABV9WBG2_9ACTN
MNDALGPAGRWARRGCAAAALLLALIDLAAAAVVVSPAAVPHRPVPYPVAALFGAHYVLLASGVCLLLVVWALLRGKRAAWWVALLAAAVSLPGHHAGPGQWPRLVATAGLLLLLLICREAFVARSDPALLRRGLAVLVVGEIAVFAYAVLGLSRLDPDFRDRETVGSAVVDALRLLFLLPVSVEPVTGHGRWFMESARTATLSVAVLGLIWLVATVIGRPGHDRERRRVRQLLDRYAATALAHFHLLDDKAWVITADGRAFVGYKVVGTTAVALGEPIGHGDSVLSAARDFAQLCALNGWNPVFHQVTGEGLPVLAGTGWKTLKIGEEAIVDLAAFDLQRPEYKGIRSSVRRCERAGYHVVDLPHPIDDATLAELREVSDAWLASGGHRERTFTLGRFDRGYLRTTPIVAVLDAGGRIQAFANIVPTYRSRDATFDLMRRRPDAVNGVVEQLFVALIERFRAGGYAGMNLGLAPLSGAGSGLSLPDRVLQLIYTHAGAAFNFAGLRAFKAKWHPRWEPRYLAYRSDARLLVSAAALVRAGELPDPRSPIGRLRRLLRRMPVTTAFLLLQAWVMTATALDPDTHGQLIRHFGLAWRDLQNGLVWRLVSSPLIQTEPGWVWSVVWLLLAFLPLAEWRLGSRRTVLIFFAADAVATLSVLLTLRLAAATGSTGAARLITERDAGSSAGSWALAAAVAWSLPGRARLLAVAGVLATLGVAVVTHRRLFDVEHLIAALVTVGACALLPVWRRARAGRAVAAARRWIGRSP